MSFDNNTTFDFGYFNSIKVQLRLANSVFMNSYHIFQFHKGTIKTSAIESHNDIVTNFNSIKVQLRPPLLWDI